MNISKIVEFNNPPLDEVVIGVQFGAPAAFNVTHTAAVTALFADEFPIIVDQPRLPPVFEIFGGAPSREIQFEFGELPVRNRVWMVSEDDSRLIQFQDDKLFLNWRKRESGGSYPSFKAMVSVFEAVLRAVKSFYADALEFELAINQMEVSYLNMIPLDNFAELGEWIKFVNVEPLQLDVFNLIFSEIVSRSGKPVARFHHEIQSAVNVKNGRPGVRLGLTYRGAPKDHSVESALTMISEAREAVVKRFCEITTDQAQKVWGRSK